MSKINRSTPSAEVSKAFVKASASVKIAIKNAVNPHLKNKYADLGAVQDACSDALQQNGLAVMQCPVPGEDGRLHLETMLVHESGEWISSELAMPLPKSDPQGYGSALTYARRYALAAMMGVTQDDEDGARASASESEAAALAACDAMRAAVGLAPLQAVFADAWRAANGDKAAQKILTSVYSDMKKLLKEGEDGSAN